LLFESAQEYTFSSCNAESAFNKEFWTLRGKSVVFVDFKYSIKLSLVNPPPFSPIILITSSSVKEPT
jgi:hypothetical protein